jgi:hypothetical protein
MPSNWPTLAIDDEPLELVGENVESAKPLRHAFELRERRLAAGCSENGRMVEAVVTVDIRLQRCRTWRSDSSV